ncbi:hypothetical protein HPB49_023479 [Dermacentor silvarum]|uniref:Uncharacterized protein n=1 Tax=Dermacentor silvarum TaxID=543639 RepID=A0ACB8E3H9_DERSI|nr:hypothetical protein HPB49_023479 [Dermacentor silvarum]
MSESESVPVENNVRKAASEEKAPADDKQDDGNSAAEERSDDEEPKLGLLYQALELSGSRQRKKVERLDVSFRTAARERPPPEQGKGTPLGDCPRIEHNIKRERSESLKALHRLLFGRPGAPSEIKKNLRKFSGFPFEKDSAEYVKRERCLQSSKRLPTGTCWVFLTWKRVARSRSAQIAFSTSCSSPLIHEAPASYQEGKEKVYDTCVRWQGPDQETKDGNSQGREAEGISKAACKEDQHSCQVEESSKERGVRRGRQV